MVSYVALRGGGVVRSLLGRGIKKCPFRGEWTLKPMSCGAAFVQPFYLLALQRWGEFLELASFLWIFLCGVCFLWGGPFSWGRENGGGCGGYI